MSSGGTDGNEVLTNLAAAVLTVLLLAEGVTILDMGGLRAPHMFIGVVLIGPVIVKLGSTGYRFAQYYLGSRAYREKGPPQIALRLLAPLLVIATIVVFATGVALLAVGHRSGLLMQLHKVSFIVWGACFGVHFLVHLPAVVRSLATTLRGAQLPGGAVRLGVVGGSVVAGLGAALLLLSEITGWRSGRI